jgi:hypothetical protein
MAPFKPFNTDYTVVVTTGSPHKLVTMVWPTLGVWPRCLGWLSLSTKQGMDLAQHTVAITGYDVSISNHVKMFTSCGRPLTC